MHPAGTEWLHAHLPDGAAGRSDGR
jgi:hypothetical protein